MTADASNQTYLYLTGDNLNAYTVSSTEAIGYFSGNDATKGVAINAANGEPTVARGGHPVQYEAVLRIPGSCRPRI